MESNKENHHQDAKQQQPIENKTQPSHETPEDDSGNEPLETAAELKWPQAENIQAAKAWHSQFPLDEDVPDEIVRFQKGRKIEESEMSNFFPN